MRRIFRHRLAAPLDTRRHAGLFLVAVAAAIATTAPAAAASIFEGVGTFDAAVLHLDPSARSQAMGGASGAVFWGDVDGWSNPAVLGLVRGVRYEQQVTDLPLGLEYEARRAELGWGGLGVALAGRPFGGIGGIRVDGDVTIDAGGPPTRLWFEEQVKSWAVGASLSRVATTIAGLRGGRPPAFTRFGDVALGFSHKDVRSGVDLALGEQAMDWGLLVRTGSDFTAYANRCRIDLAYGYSVQNANDIGARRPHRHGTAVRLSLDPPALSQLRATLGLHPLVELGGAWDRVFTTLEGRRTSDQTRLGAEIALANVAFVRFGQQANGATSASGFGFALPVGNLAKVRYDHARVKNSVASDVAVDGWSAWFDLLAIAGVWRRG